MAILLGHDSFGNEVWALDVSGSVPEMYHSWYCRCGGTERNSEEGPEECTCPAWDITRETVFYRYFDLQREVKYAVEDTGSVSSVPTVGDTYRTRIEVVNPLEREIRAIRARRSRKSRRARRMSHNPL